MQPLTIISYSRCHFMYISSHFSVVHAATLFSVFPIQVEKKVISEPRLLAWLCLCPLPVHSTPLFPPVPSFLTSCSSYNIPNSKLISTCHTFTFRLMVVGLDRTGSSAFSYKWVILKRTQSKSDLDVFSSPTIKLQIYMKLFLYCFVKQKADLYLKEPKSLGPTLCVCI